MFPSARITIIVVAAIAIAGSISGCAAHPSTTTMDTMQGIASYYSNDFQGHRTADGEIFDNSKLTAAHRTYPFGTIVRVTNLATEATVTVRINDRGPVKPERVIDLTQAAAEAIGIVRAGLGRVRIDVVEWGKGKV
ncbi:MAG TPA: septal ring lytic transglycosylase RlpA family protein [Candidatus Kapabacteria bacterium]|nr:septal ring lytic transglycosylase RlpA family protein [Candidatus Kapabacteria bacterium]